MTAFVLGLPEHKVRVIAPDVGGGFGSKIYLYPGRDGDGLGEQARRPPDQMGRGAQRGLPLRRARARPRHARRARARQGRQVPRAESVETTANMGAYLSTFASCIPTILYATLLAGQYTTPAIWCEVTAVFTNTAPVDAYRGAGRPEATYVVERIVHQAAVETGIAQDEIRRRNFIRTFPYQTPVALNYDIGNYDATLDEAMRMADVDGFAARQAQSKARGKLRGIGYASYIEACGLAPSNIAGALGARAGLFEAGQVRVQSHRQRHRVHRLAQPRPGTRDDVRADRRRAARHAGRQRRRRARRHRPHSVRHGHVRLALAVGRRHGHREGARQDRREGPQDRRAPARGRRGGHRVQGRQVQRRRHRPQQDVRRNRAHRVRAAQLSARQARARPRRDGVLRSDQLHVSGRHAHLRGRGRPRYRRRRRARRSARATTSATSSIR